MLWRSLTNLHHLKGSPLIINYNRENILTLDREKTVFYLLPLDNSRDSEQLGMIAMFAETMILPAIIHILYELQLDRTIIINRNGSSDNEKLIDELANLLNGTADAHHKAFAAREGRS